MNDKKFKFNFIFVGFLSAKLKNLRLKVQGFSDLRLQQMQETLSVIKIIKMYCWEQFFYNRVSAARKYVQNNTVNTKLIDLFIIF